MTATSIPRPVQLGITALCTGLCSLLFLVVYGQLWLLLHYRQKRLSYQSSLLFLGLLWAACRTVLFSFYLTDCAGDDELRPFPHWVLYCSPVCLQFCGLCLLILYFSQFCREHTHRNQLGNPGLLLPHYKRVWQVIFKARSSPEFNKYKVPLQIGFLLACLAFLIVNLSCILVVYGVDDQRQWITMTRVVFSDCLFAVGSLSLANNTYRIGTMTPANVYLESKGSSGNRAVLTGSVISALYLLRALYNLVVVSLQANGKPTPFSYGWNGATDHVVTEEVDGLEYLLFGLVVLVCEFIPMSFMTYFFRAKKLSQNLQTAGMVNSHSFGSRAYFFDNPRRYDSDDDLPRLAGSRGERGSLSSTPKSSGWYGTICPTSGCALAPPLLSEPSSSGTPVLFSCGANALA